MSSDPFGEGLTIVASAAFLGAVLAAVIFITPVALLGFGAFAGYHLELNQVVDDIIDVSAFDRVQTWGQLKWCLAVPG